MIVWVLQDRDGHVFGVVSDADAAEEFLTFDESFVTVEVEVDDFTLVNEIRDAVEEDEVESLS